MSICGNCHYNQHSDKACNHDCTIEDAVYREQMAYNSLYEEYKELKEKYDMLYNIADSFNAIPLYMRPYSSDEKRVRDSLPPMMWSTRDWQAYNEENKVKIEAAKTLDQIVDIWINAGENYHISAEETTTALETTEQKTIKTSGASKGEFTWQ